MKNIFNLFLIFMLLLSFSCQKVEKTINIGFIGPMTGDAANYGKLMSQAIKIAVEEKNSTGGIGGNKINLIIEDDEGKVEKANACIEKLSNINKVYGIIGAVFSSCSLAIAPKAQSDKIVMISPSSTHKDLTNKGDFIFRTVLTDQFQAIVFGKYVANELKIKKLAILYLKNDYSQGLAEDFKKEFEANGGIVVAMESALQGDKDFKTQLTKIKATNPEALYMPNYISEMAQILEQAKQLGLNVKFLSADGFSNPDIFNLAGDLANGVIFSNSAEEKNNVLRTQFEEKYEKKFNEKPDSFALNSYDAAVLIINAIEKVYNESSKEEKEKILLNRDKIREYVASTSNFNGVSGLITFLPNGDVAKNIGIFISENKSYKQIAAYKIENNNLVIVE